MNDAQSPVPLTQQSAVELLRQGLQGVLQWNQYRNSGGEVPDMAGVNLSNLNLSQVDFADIDLTGSDLQKSRLDNANLSRACLADVNLDGAVLKGAKLSAASLKGTTLRFVEAAGVNFSELREFADCDFSNSILADTDFSKLSLVSCRFEKANLSRARLMESNLTGVILFECKLQEAKLVDANLQKANLEKCDLTNANLAGAKGAGVNFEHAMMRGVKASGCNLVDSYWTGASLDSAICINAVVSRGLMNGIKATNANFVDASLDDCIFDSANLGHAMLHRASIRGCKFNSKTNLEGADVRDCAVDRHSLDGLRDYGGLTAADLAEMDIRDDVALLRSRYSGFWQWFHLAALGLFIAPYVWFLVSEYSTSTFSENFEGRWMRLWEALLRFVYFGGIDWARTDWAWPHPSLYIFVFAFIYNLLRFALLYKTKQLELIELATGVSTKFSLRQRTSDTSNGVSLWGLLHQLATWGFYVNIVLVLINCLHFLSRKIPISP